MVLRSGQIVDMEVEPTRLAGILDIQVTERRVKENPQVLDWTTGSTELALTEMEKGDRFKEDSKSLAVNKVVLRCFLEASQGEVLARAL